MSLWAAVSHYLPGGPNPKAALALVEQVTNLLEVPVDEAPWQGLDPAQRLASAVLPRTIRFPMPKVETPR